VVAVRKDEIAGHQIAGGLTWAEPFDSGHYLEETLVEL
jgi:hypothetical protein